MPDSNSRKSRKTGEKKANKLPDSSLIITNARENNLKSVSLNLPHNTYIGVTGLSGSGKSSLAFDTIYAEGQRRYIETFSPYTRQFFDKVKKPDVDLIENIRPAIAIQQKTRVVNSRSTVGSLTDINDYLKILWSNLSISICPECGVELKSWTPEELAKHIGATVLAGSPGAAKTYLVGAYRPIGSVKKDVVAELEKLSQQGYIRLFLPQTVELTKIEDLLAGIKEKKSGSIPESIFIILDRYKVSDSDPSFDKKRLQESIREAFALSNGRCSMIELDSSDPASSRTIDFFESPQCPVHKYKFQKPKQALFSYNHPLGACLHCKGFGNILSLDLNLCIPDQSKSLEDKCIVPWSTASTKSEYRELLKFCADNKIPVDKPWRALTEKQHDLIINTKIKGFWGIRHWFGWLEKRTYKMHYRIFLSKYRTQSPCPECNGTRLKKDALVYRIDGKTIADAWNLPVGELYGWISENNRNGFSNSGKKISRQLNDVIKALLSRLKYLIDLGLGYLTLERQARTLSGGETQRVNLAGAIGSELTSTQFVLDEPSVGLHARDSERLTKSIKELHKRGNSILAVEHDPDFLEAAEYILELGPKSGKEGGEVTFFDSAEKWRGISFDQEIVRVDKQKIDSSTQTLRIRNASTRNLKNVSVDIPLQRLVCLTGVSGSGKSTLVKEIIEKGISSLKKGDTLDFSISGFESLEQVLLVDQTPLAKSPRANIATYSGIWDTVRDIFAKTESAQARALTRSSFSFNVNAGRCTNCDGAGFIKEDMQFLSDVYIPCENCLGTRFQQTVLEVTYQDKNVHQILNTSIDECINFFPDYENIVRAASYLSRLGLGHLTLGHSLSELSGGEAQRLKLIPFIEKSSRGNSLLIFDEPTTGLHIRDVEKFIGLLRFLRDEGHSVLCIEHNLSLILASDWIIDLGPEGGDGGGEIIFYGTPEFAIQHA